MPEPDAPKPKPRQTRTEGRRSKMLSATMPSEYHEKLAAIVADAGEGSGGVSGAIRRMIDREHAELLARREADARRVFCAVKMLNGWGVGRWTMASGIELLSDGYRTKTAAEKAAREFAGDSEISPPSR